MRGLPAILTTIASREAERLSIAISQIAGELNRLPPDAGCDAGARDAVDDGPAASSSPIDLSHEIADILFGVAALGNLLAVAAGEKTGDVALDRGMPLHTGTQIDEQARKAVELVEDLRVASLCGAP